MSIDVTSEFQKAFEEFITAARLSFFIKDTNDALVDFSDRLQDDGKNLLASLGQLSLSHVSESREGTGATSSLPNKIRLDNSNDFFNKKFPSILKTIDSSTASFAETSNKKQSVLYNKECQFRIEVVLKDGRTEAGIIGDYLLGEMTRGLSPFVDIELVDKSLPLRREDSAERVKDGYDFWKNRPIPFLIQECLKIRYRKSDGTLPSDFVIPDKVSIEAAASIRGDSGDVRVVSHFGKQPEINDSGTWLNKGLICRAQVVGPTPANLSSDASPAAASPDAKTLYMGCDDELWYWDLDTEQSTLIDESTLGAGFNIRHLWYSSHQLKIYGVAYAIQSTYAGTSNPQGETVKVFKYDGTAFSVIATFTNASGGGVQTGDFCYRSGRAISGARLIGQTTTDTAGENIPLVYGQSLLFAKNTAKFREKTSISDTVITGTSFVLKSTPFGSKFSTYYTLSDSTDPGNSHLRWSIGQKGFFVFNSQSTSDIYLWYAEFSDAPSGGPGTLRIKRVNLVTGVSQVIVSDFDMGTGERIDPLCGCPDSDNSNIFIGAVFWDDATGFNISHGLIYKVTSAGTLTKLYDAPADSAAADQYFTPIDMIHNSSANKLVVSLFARNRLGQSDAYVLAEHSDSAAADVTVKHSRRFELRGFINGKNDTNLVYMQDISTGKIGYYDTDNGTLIFADDGFPPVENEFGLSIPQLAVDGDTYTGSFADIIYGVSSPTPVLGDAYESIPSGKFYLYKLDKFYSGRIELFEVSGMNIWKPLEFLAQMADYKFGFSKDGRFYFVDKAFENTSDFIFDLDAADALKFRGVSVKENINEVYNLITIIPTTVFLQSPEWDLRLVTREGIVEGDDQTSDTKKPFDSEILIQQKDDRRKTLSLECVIGGLVSEGKAAMKYRSLDEIFETRLIAAPSAGDSTIIISSGILDIRKGDTIRLEGAEVNEERTVKSLPTDSDKETGTVTLESVLENSYAIGDFVEVTHNLSTWSDQRNNFISDPYFEKWTSNELDDWSESDGNIDAQDDISVFRYGKVTARLDLTGGTDSYIYQNIAASILSASTRYTVVVDVLNFEGDDTVNRSEEIELKITSDDGSTAGGAILAVVSDSSTSTAWKTLSVTFTTTSSPTGSVQIQLHCKGNSTTKGWVDGCFMMVGDFAAPDVLLLRNDAFIPIPDASVEFKFTAQSEETEMLPGDRLVIQCPGLILQKEEASKQTAIDLTSRNRYGERSYPTIENPYLTRSLARDISRRILNDFAFPKYKISFNTKLLPHIDFITSNNKVTTITLKSEKLFKESPGWAERCMLLNIVDKLVGSSQFSLRALEKI